MPSEPASAAGLLSLLWLVLLWLVQSLGLGVPGKLVDGLLGVGIHAYVESRTFPVVFQHGRSFIDCDAVARALWLSWLERKPVRS